MRRAKVCWNEATQSVNDKMDGKLTFEQCEVSRHRQIMNLGVARPIVSEGVFVAPSASVIGDVDLAAKSGVWYGAVLRADSGRISVGEGAQVFERSVLNTTSGAVTLGALARVDAGSLISGAELDDECAVGAGCVVRGARVGKHAMLAPGSSLDVGTEVPAGELWVGAPAVFVRKLSADEVSALVKETQDTVVLAEAHAAENGKTFDQIEAERLREELMRDRSNDYHSHLGIVGKEVDFINTQAKIVEDEREAQAAAGRT